jgi:transcriptional regulator with XRE-family HTH domain
MGDEFDFATADRTLARGELEPATGSDPCSDAILALLRHHIDLDSRSLSQLAGQLGISRRQLGRILGGQRPLRVVDLRALTDLLEIDCARASVAIEVMGDWHSYDDPGLCIVMQMLNSVVTGLNDKAHIPIEPLTKPAQNTLANWLIDTIIANQEQILRRREAFINLPQL